MRRQQQVGRFQRPGSRRSRQPADPAHPPPSPLIGHRSSGAPRTAVCLPFADTCRVISAIRARLLASSRVVSCRLASSRVVSRRLASSRVVSRRLASSSQELEERRAAEQHALAEAAESKRKLAETKRRRVDGAAPPPSAPPPHSPGAPSPRARDNGMSGIARLLALDPRSTSDLWRARACSGGRTGGTRSVPPLDRSLLPTHMVAFRVAFRPIAPPPGADALARDQ